MRSHIFTTLLLTASALGNTEIFNFPATQASFVDLPFTNSWPILSSQSSTLKWNVTSAPLDFILPQTVCQSLPEWRPSRPHACPHELWVILDTDGDDWQRFEKFTFRLSWPAFHPTDISMTIYDPTALIEVAENSSSIHSQQTRRKYGRIQMVHTGILTFPEDVSFAEASSRYEVPIFLILEPLYFGVIPKTVIPVALALLVVILLSLPVAAAINRALQKIVTKAKEESKVPQNAKTD